MTKSIKKQRCEAYVEKTLTALKKRGFIEENVYDWESVGDAGRTLEETIDEIVSLNGGEWPGKVTVTINYEA